jgi:3-hydroxybutyryl-CoA dehydrogenase
MDEAIDVAGLATGTLLVVGAGTMGQQIALQAAMQDVKVVLTDISDARLTSARARIQELLDGRVAKGRITADAASAALGHLTLTSDLAGAAPTCSWAIEAVAERLDVKAQVFAEMASLLPADAGLASNSSHIRAATISEGKGWAERCLNMHFFHPVLVMDLVEVVPSPATSPNYMEAAVAWSHRIKRKPLVLRRDLDGFLVNRILGEASREAFAMLSSGVASFSDIDAAVTRGLRWPLGPFQLADLSGIDILLQSRSDRYERHGTPGDLATVKVLGPMVRQDRLGRKVGIGFYDYSVDPPKPVPLPSESVEGEASAAEDAGSAAE